MPLPEYLRTSLSGENKRSLQYSLLLHVGIVIVAVVLGSLHRIPDVEPPRVVEAVLVSASTLPRPATVKPEPVPEPAPEPLQEPEPVKVPEPAKPDITPVEKPLPASLPKVALPTEKPVTKPAPAKPAPAKPSLNRNALDEEMRALEREMKAQQMKADAERAQRETAVAAATARDAANQALREKHERLIRQRVITKWNRPLSARHGMVTTLRITVLPGGEVSNVVTVKSSGDPSFDASAEDAVRRSSPLPVPDDIAVFNSYFRVIAFRFSPEDM
jgi:colicin import membrane protein